MGTINSRFDILDTALSGLKVIQRKPLADARGYLCRFFCADEFRAAGFERPIAQINHTLTYKAGTVRGLHFQYPPHAEIKVVSCLKGEIFDVAVDIRKGSPTFLKWHAEMLSASNQRSLLVPEGFAHGFQALSEDCEILYLVSEKYSPLSEGALNAIDPRLSIAWPHIITELSERDKAHPFIDNAFEGVSL